MDKSFIDGLKKRYDFSSWKGRKTLDENLFVRNYFLRQDFLPGWKMQRIQRVTPPALPEGMAARHAQIPEPVPPLIQSIWSRPEARSETILKVDVYECDSREAADEYLIRLLGEYQLPEIVRQDQLEVGNVAFGNIRGNVVAFTRANLVYVLGNAGRDLLPVTEIARQLDQELISRPATRAEGDEVGKWVVEFRRSRPQVSEVKVGARVNLDLNVTSPTVQEFMCKFFSRAGEIQSEKGKLTYRPVQAGEQDIEVVVVAPDQTATSERMTFLAK